MGCPMRGYHGWQGGHGGGGGMWSSMPVVPAPMVGLSMLVGILFGMLIGMMFGKKHAVAMMYGRGHGGAKWRKSMMHHHHGFGMQGCCSEHKEPAGESNAMSQSEGGVVPDMGSGI